ncbi:tetratricopeptide repeat protein [Alkalicoccus halolimnae]|uniref:Tetratricopeptide repeat protein n=1 Tax=Alkalicoccus halolimnae TaxID=1667239 RepID=A0A5C7FIX7_9BACI|nr:tetratricopeptide repeat protein [Alkalicoccus halolimnae]TXF84319.1 tetratricopeptide repeat protein [Alkalicoccus halolimnae]
MNPINQHTAQVIPFMQDGSYFYKKGIEAYENKQVSRSLHFIRRAIQLEPREPIFLCQLAIVLAEEGNYEEANDWLLKIKNEVDPKMSECYFFLANNQAHTGDFKEAKENLEMYLELDKEGEFREDADALLYLLNVELGIEHNKADSSTPFYSTVLMKLHEGDYAAAEKEAGLIIAEKPEEWETYAMLAEALWKRNKQKKAEQILSDLLTKENPVFFARCQYTMLLHDMDSPEAAAWIESLKHLHPMDRWERYAAGRALYHAEEYEASFAMLKSTVPLDSPVYSHQLAVAAARSGRFQKALRLWGKNKGLPEHRSSRIQQMKDRAREKKMPGEHGSEWLY